MNTKKKLKSSESEKVNKARLDKAIKTKQKIIESNGKINK